MQELTLESITLNDVIEADNLKIHLIEADNHWEIEYKDLIEWNTLEIPKILKCCTTDSDILMECNGFIYLKLDSDQYYIKCTVDVFIDHINILLLLE